MGQKSETSFNVTTSLQIHFNPGHEQAAKQVHRALAAADAELTFNGDGPHIMIPMNWGDGFRISESFAATVHDNGGHFCAAPIASFLNKVGRAVVENPASSGGGSAFGGGSRKRQSAFADLATFALA
ncbi:MAG: hypothetical protein WC043_09195 [Pseudobdellovibrionaceae bacterium]